MSLYSTWYEFKRDLEARLGHWLPNEDWLEARPRDPLPWDEISLAVALQKAAHIKAGRAGEGAASGSAELAEARS